MTLPPDPPTDTAENIAQLAAKLTVLKQRKQTQNDDLVLKLEPMAEAMDQLADMAQTISQHSTIGNEATVSLRESLATAQHSFHEAMSRLQTVSQQIRDQQQETELRQAAMKPHPKTSVLQQYHWAWLGAIAGLGFLVGLSVGLGLWLDASERQQKSLQEVRKLRSDQEIVDHVLHRLYPKLNAEQQAELNVIYHQTK